MKREPILEIAKWREATASAEDLLERLEEGDEPAALALVDRLAPHDLLVAARIADDEQRAALLRIAPKEHVDLLVDLCCWQRGLPDLDALTDLIAPLALGGVEDADHALRAMEPELRTLLLRRNVRIHLLDNRNDELSCDDDAELLSSPDGFYHVEVTDADQMTDVERALYQALFHRPFEDYQPELECVRHELPADLTESAARWRNARLADLGFLPRDEAVSLLAPRSVAEIRALADAGSASLRPVPFVITLPALYGENLAGHDFLDLALEEMRTSGDPAVAARRGGLMADLSSMVSQYLTATDVDLSDLAAVARGAGFARDLLALGLQETAAGDPAEGSRLLAALPPGFFLQAGLGLLYPLQRRAVRLLWSSGLVARPGGEGALDPPYRVALACLARDIPCRWPVLDDPGSASHGLLDPMPHELAAFASPGQVEAAERLVAEAEQLPRLLFEALGCGAPPRVAHVPASILVLTALANTAADRPATTAPLTVEEARVFGAEALAIQEEDFLADALAVLAPLFGVEAELPAAWTEHPDPALRLAVRLLVIGRGRLAADAAERVVLVEHAK